jgi:hypothetical protein
MKIGSLVLIFKGGKQNNDEDEKRPVKMIEERPNVWRIVYADQPKSASMELLKTRQQYKEISLP